MINIDHKDLETSAHTLFCAGWLPQDREDMIRNFDLRIEEADTVCRYMNRDLFGIWDEISSLMRPALREQAKAGATTKAEWLTAYCRIDSDFESLICKAFDKDLATIYLMVEMYD